MSFMQMVIEVWPLWAFIGGLALFGRFVLTPRERRRNIDTDRLRVRQGFEPMHDEKGKYIFTTDVKQYRYEQDLALKALRAEDKAARKRAG